MHLVAMTRISGHIRELQGGLVDHCTCIYIYIYAVVLWVLVYDQQVY